MHKPAKPICFVFISFLLNQWHTRTTLLRSLAGNALSGTVPEAWGAQRGLAALLLSSNAALCGPVPGVIQPMLLAATANATVSCGNCTSSAQETSALAAAINGTQLLRSCTWLQEGAFATLRPALSGRWISQSGPQTRATPIHATGSLLLSLRHSMSGPSSTLAEWAEGTDPCGVSNAWEGVLCDSVAHTVTGLDLSDKGERPKAIMLACFRGWPQHAILTRHRTCMQGCRGLSRPNWRC